MSMTFNSLYRNFLTEVGKHRVGTVLPDDFARLFNMAVEEVVTNKLSAMDANKKIVDDLNVLVKTWNAMLTENTTELTKCFSIERPSDCRRIKNIRVLLNGNTSAKCMLLASNLKYEKLNGVYDRPSDKRVYYEFSNNNTSNTINVFVPITTTSVKIYADYYKNPTAITSLDATGSGSSVYSNEMCTEIINVAARMCIEQNQDARYQTFAADLKNKNVNQ